MTFPGAVCAEGFCVAVKESGYQGSVKGGGELWMGWLRGVQ